MIKILHGADFHLDSAFSALSPEKAAKARREQRQALEQLGQIANDCDLVLLSGDLFDSARIYRDSLDALKQLFGSIQAQVFIAPGNHDFITPGSPYLTEDWGKNVHIFTSSQMERISLPELNCHVYGAAFTAAEMPDLLGEFHVEDPEAYNLMVLHGDLQANSSYSPLSPDAIAASGLDYLALGHVHSRSAKKFGATLCAYPGCLMGRGFDECGEKGVSLLTLGKDRCEEKFIPLNVRKYEILSVEVGDDPLSSIRAVLPKDTSRDCYRIILTGEAEPLDMACLEEQLAAEFFSLTLRDCTVPKKELWAAAREDSLRGHFLRTLKAEYDSSDEVQKDKLAQAAKLVTALMDGREVPL